MRFLFKQLRILPLTIFAAMVLLGVKVGDIVRGTQDLRSSIEQPIPAALAADEEEAGGEEASKEDESGAEDADADEEAAGGDEQAPAEGEDDTAEMTDMKEAEDDVTLPGEVEDKLPRDKRHFTQIEIDILQSLQARREEIESYAEEVQMKENLLEATEQRINDKIKEMQALQAEIEVILAEYNEQEDAKIRSLVKIYESMKPKDAAQIFEEVEMPVLLMVIDKMSERKVAPVLAAMTPLKAKMVTQELADQRRLRAAGPIGQYEQGGTN